MTPIHPDHIPDTAPFSVEGLTIQLQPWEKEPQEGDYTWEHDNDEWEVHAQYHFDFEQYKEHEKQCAATSFPLSEPIEGKVVLRNALEFELQINPCGDGWRTAIHPFESYEADAPLRWLAIPINKGIEEKAPTMQIVKSEANLKSTVNMVDDYLTETGKKIYSGRELELLEEFAIWVVCKRMSLAPI